MSEPGSGRGIITPRLWTGERNHWHRLAKLGHGATQELVITLLRVLSISPYRLGHLLGAGDRGVGYRWKAGTSRPGHLYLGRMLMLALLHHEIPAPTIRYIHWATGTVTLWEDQSNNDLSDYISAKSDRNLQQTEGDGFQQVPTSSQGPQRPTDPFADWKPSRDVETAQPIRQMRFNRRV